MRLAARLRAFLGLAGPQEPPALDALEKRVAALELALEADVERELKWQEQQVQLRRFLGRLDAHAGKAKGEANGGGARADVIAAKFPQGLPRKE